MKGDTMEVFGDGTTRRDYTYVDDIVSGVASALSYDRSPYEIINLGNDRTVPLSELLSLLESALGRPAIVCRKPEQPGDVPQTWADIGKARALLGYNPAVGFHAGIKRLVEWANR